VKPPDFLISKIPSLIVSPPVLKKIGAEEVVPGSSSKVSEPLPLTASVDTVGSDVLLPLMLETNILDTFNVPLMTIVEAFPEALIVAQFTVSLPR
jgi:hypothetical protein